MTIKDKNILFIIPPYFNIDYYRSGETNYTLPAFTVPYGLLSMEAYIRKHAACNVKMEILDLNLEVFKIIDDMCNIHDDLFEILAKKLEDKTDIVGISAIFNSAYNYIGDIVSIVKKAVNPPMCLLGGGLATNLYTKILNTFLGIDGICFAEGEIPMVDLINAKDPYEVLSDHPSWITAESITTGRAPVSSFVKNLDDIPIFTYDSICLDDYNTRSLDKKHNTETTKRELSIHTSRGCPFDCIYCANASSHGKKIRFMSVERVIAEVDDMIEKYGMNVLLVEDDHFLANKERTVKILKALGQRNIRIEFPNGLAVYKIDEEIGELLKFAGATTVQLAVESGSDYVLNQIIKKPHKSSQVKSAADILKKNDIIVHAFIVIGLPGEMEIGRAHV